MKLACCCHCACAVRMVFALCCGDVGVPLQGAWAGCCLLWMAVQSAVRFFSEAAGCVACGEWYAILFKFRGHRICIANAGQVACHIHRRKKNINTGMLVCIMSVCANRIRANRCEGARTGANRCEPVRIGANRCESVRTGANRCESVRIKYTRRARCCNGKPHTVIRKSYRLNCQIQNLQKHVDTVK